MSDERDGALMTTSLPPDRISLYSNFDDEESWLMPVDEKSGELADWLDGAMKDFDKTGLKKQKRKIQQQNNNSNGCDLITEEEDEQAAGNEIFYDAETEFENDKKIQQDKALTISTTPSPRNNVLQSNGNGKMVTSTPKIAPPKTKSMSPNPRPESRKKSNLTLSEMEKKADDQERELLELLMRTDSRPASSASNFGNVSNASARSGASLPQSTSGLIAHDTSGSSTHSNPEPATTLRPGKLSKIPVPQRFNFKSGASRRSAGNTNPNSNGSHIPYLSRPYSSSNSDTSSNPDQWGGGCF